MNPELITNSTTPFSFDPRDFGVDLDRDRFVDMVAKDFVTTFGGLWLVNELLLYPAQAQKFCNFVRRTHKVGKIPDDLILRSLVQRTKGLW